MEVRILLLQQLCSLVLMGALGYLIRRLNLISHEGSIGLTSVCVYICSPCILFEAFQTELSPERMAGFAYAVISVIVIHVVYFLAMWIIRKICPLDIIESVSIIYSNCGNMIIPLVTGVFGQQYIFYTCAYLFVQNGLLWSHAKREIGGKNQVSWRKIFLHPCILAMALGALFMICQWTLPRALDTAVSGMADCVGPLSMLIVGTLIAEIDLKNIFVNRRIYMVTFMRLLLYPMLAVISAFLVRILFPAKVDTVVCLIVVLGSSGPAATTLTQLAQIYDNDPGYASSINVLTSLACIVTMPLVITVAQTVLQWRCNIE